MNTGVKKYVVIPGNKVITDNANEQFPSGFIMATGSYQEEEFYNAIGDGIRSRRKRKDKRLDIKDKKVSGKTSAAQTRANAKVLGAKANIAAAKSLGGNQSDAELLKAMAKTGAPEKKGMSTTNKVLLIGGAVILVSGISYLIYRSFKGKKSA